MTVSIPWRWRLRSQTLRQLIDKVREPLEAWASVREGFVNFPSYQGADLFDWLNGKEKPSDVTANSLRRGYFRDIAHVPDLEVLGVATPAIGLLGGHRLSTVQYGTTEM